MATDSRKRLALAIIDFLSTSLQDGTLQPEDADSIEIASNCIAECFHVDPTDETAVRDATGGQSLLGIYGVYEKLKGKSTASTTGPSSAAEGKPSTPTGGGGGGGGGGSVSGSGLGSGTGSTVPKKGEKGGPTDESEQFKGQGNAAMQKKDYQTAIEYYTKALEISPLNPIYLSNRAAAYSAANQHEFAKNDAELATATDPKYTKAWSRLGLALFALGDARGSMEAYQKGIEAEGNGGSEAMKKGYETAKKRVQETGANVDLDGDDDDEEETSESVRSQPGAGAGGRGGGGGLPDLGGLASMLGGSGGGLPDLSSIMSNPMMRSMAQNLMSNPEMMDNIMNNPQLRNMASRFGGGGGGGSGGQAEGGGAGGGGAGGGGGGGGGMPNLSEMMNDPAIAEMARNFMGSMGGGGGAGRGSGGGGAP